MGFSEEGSSKPDVLPTIFGRKEAPQHIQRHTQRGDETREELAVGCSRESSALKLLVVSRVLKKKKKNCQHVAKGIHAGCFLLTV